ncbi:MAG: flagellar filament capping protein FliD [Syntrophobacteraceae bacterium]
MAGLSVSGIGSGIDWQSILDKLSEVEQQRLKPLTTSQTTYNKKLAAWQEFSSKLSSLKTASFDLKYSTSFNIFSASLTSSSSVSAGSLLSATASSSATKGSYQVVVTSRAEVEKLASGSFSSQTEDLGISGAILVNGKAVQVEATDSLDDLASKINSMNTSDANDIGVTAGVIQDSPGSFRLVLTSEGEGSDGISLGNGSAGDTLGSLGFNGTGTAVKNQTAGAALSDSFSSTSTSVEALLGIESQNLSGSVTINGKTVAIDLTDTLDTIKNNLNAAGISASIVSETSGTATTSRLKIEGMSSWTDNNNILQAIGVIEGNRNDLIGVTGGVGNTTDGTAAITSATNIVDIYGYLNNSPGDKITISGTKHDGTAVTADFAIDGTKTVGDLLSQVQTLFGDVTASITSDGKIQVLDNATGTSQLSVNLETTVLDPNGGVLDFGSFGEVGAVRKYVLQQGTDAAFTLDGLSMTSKTNTVTGAIPGVTLNLLGEDPNTAVTVNVGRDGAGIEAKVQAMLNSYNDVISYVNSQMTYNADAGTTGGPLFGDNALKSIKVKLQSAMMSAVGDSSIKYMTDIGITVGKDNKLSIDSTKFQSVLGTNFDDVVKLFSDSGSSENGQFHLASSGRTTVSGTYRIDISQLSGSGLDIAGQIDGLDATGYGDLLTLNNSASGANGLGIRYTGTSLTSTDFTFTRGIASLLESEAYALTDPLNGTATLQQNSMQTNIDAVKKKITDMQTIIDMKMALYKEQFIAMDAAVAQMQSMQTYLANQFD